MSKKSFQSNVFLDSALSWHYPPFSEENGLARVVAFGAHSHKCPTYVRQIPPCTAGCPAGNDIRAWLTTVAQSGLKGRSWRQSYEMAWHEASKTTPFPAICGRVCPHPCETGCNRGQKDKALNITSFERWIGDYGIQHGLEHKKLHTDIMAEKVAVIGAGPAGLSCAFQLARRGYSVSVFEALPEPGGMLRYGIPAFRLPRAVLNAEIGAITKMGVTIACNTVVGVDLDLQELRERFEAVFIGIGAHAGRKLNIEDEDVDNLFSGVGFLHRVNSGQSVEIGASVVVIGGGNTAVTAARVARRLGAQVTIIYRRTRAEMPTLEREIEDSLLEGITIQYLVAPVGIRKENSKAVAVRCQKMELGDLDGSGRRKAVPVSGSDFEVPCTALISAIGQHPESERLHLPTEAGGWLKPDETLSVGKEMYAGGDVLELALVTTAIGHGRQAAEQIDARFRGKRRSMPVGTEAIILHDALRLEYFSKQDRNEANWTPENERCTKGLDLEADLGISEEQFRAESQRCMSCGLCFQCRQCLIYCPQEAIEEFPQNPTGEVMYTHYTKCIGCHICSQACPCGYIKMGMSDEL